METSENKKGNALKIAIAVVIVLLLAAIGTLAYFLHTKSVQKINNIIDKIFWFMLFKIISWKESPAFK